MNAEALLLAQVLSEWLNDSAPIGERHYLPVAEAILSGASPGVQQMISDAYARGVTDEHQELCSSPVCTCDLPAVIAARAARAKS